MKKITLAVPVRRLFHRIKRSPSSPPTRYSHLDRDRYEPVLLGIGRWTPCWTTWHTDARHTVPAVISPTAASTACCSSPPLLYPIWTPPFRYSMAKAGGRHGQGLLGSRYPRSGLQGCSPPPVHEQDAALPGRAAGIAVPLPPLFRTGEGLDTLPERTASLTYPLFVKPARAGSSLASPRWRSPACCRSRHRRPGPR